MTDDGRPGPADDHASMPPIAIAGFMGVGKSSVGRRVALELDRAFFDSDQVIVERIGRPIAEVFADGEEAMFRDLEAAVIAELVDHRPAAVIALGGGALGRSSTRELLLERSLLIHLAQPWERLRPALSHLAAGRPLLKGASEDEIHELFLARQELYSIAHITVTTYRRGTPRAAREVLAAIDAYLHQSRDEPRAAT